MHKLTAIVPDEYDGNGELIRGTKFETGQLDEAKLLGSRVDKDRHIIALDLDMPAALVPSSTPGHYHLYIDHEISWDEYVSLLDLLADIGVIEPGYAEVSKRRKETHLRTPWTVKGEYHGGSNHADPHQGR